MKVIDILNEAKEKQTTYFSFELLPPLKGNSIEKVFSTIDKLREFDPKYINITAHRDEVIFTEAEKGVFQKKSDPKKTGNSSGGSSYSKQI